MRVCVRVTAEGLAPASSTGHRLIGGDGIVDVVFIGALSVGGLDEYVLWEGEGNERYGCSSEDEWATR